MVKTRSVPNPLNGQSELGHINEEAPASLNQRLGPVHESRETGDVWRKGLGLVAPGKLLDTEIQVRLLLFRRKVPQAERFSGHEPVP